MGNIRMRTLNSGLDEFVTEGQSANDRNGPFSSWRHEP
jgi:hypothetical protein